VVAETMSLQLRQLVVCIVALWVSPLAAQSPDKTADAEFTPNAARGYQLLTTKPYLPPDFDQEVFDELWKVWPKTLRDQARNAPPAERRQLAFTRYGMVESPGRGAGL
jgi:hypothetical protein